MATKHQDNSLLEAKRTQLAPPPLYKVLLLNDDFTPMDFVIVVLQKVFWDGSRTRDANHAQSSHRGSGCLWVYPRDVAATKVEQVTAFARKQPASPGVRNGGKLNDCAGT
jgi:ATP-dependent Clp protease adaptor protein ClpS